MVNFNKTVDLLKYLPNYLREFREIQEIMKVETPIVKNIWNNIENVMNDQFITEATENGVSRREKMLGITPYANDTLNDRKFRLMARYQESVPYTRKGLESLLASLCGEDGYKINIDTHNFSIDIKVALIAKKQEESVRELLERILPYNMIFTVSLLYNQWQTISVKTWNSIENLTWRELREEVIS